MTFNEYRKKHNGFGIDVDNYPKDAPFQCMDNLHMYCVEVLGITDLSILAAPAARDVYEGYPNTFGSQFFDKIDNTPTGIPQKGDIMFWGTGIGKYGHVSIFIDGDVNNFNSFDQNWNAHQYCEVVRHTYIAVLGWLRFKPAVQTDQQALIDQLRKERDTNWDLYAQFKDAGYEDIDAVVTAIKNSQETLDSCNQLIKARNEAIAQQNSQISTLTSQVTDVTTQRDMALEQAKLVPDLKKQNEALSDKVKLYQEAEKTWNRTKGQMQTQIDSLKKNSFQALVKSIVDKLFSKNG